MTACPAAGASITMRSAAPARSSCLTLPSTRMSFIPGTAVATTSSAPELASRRPMRRRPWSSRYSTRASSGVRVRAHARTQLGLFVGERRAPERARQADFPSTSTTNTLAPARAAATDNAAVTVVFPTPPLPATTTTRRSRRSARGPWPRMLGLSNSSSRGRSARADRRGRNPGLGLRRRRPTTRRAGGIDVVQVEGWFDASTNRWCATRSSRRTRRATMIVLQVKSNGAIDAGVDDIVREIDQSACRWWCGSVRPARMPRERARCCSSCPHLAFVSPSSSGARAPGAAGRPRCVERTTGGEPARRARRAARRDPEGARKLADAARRARLVRSGRPTACGRRSGSSSCASTAPVETAAGEVELSTAKVVGEGRPPSAAEPGGAVHPARPRRSGAPPVDQPVDRVLPVRRGAGAARVRVLHRLDRARRPRRRALLCRRVRRVLLLPVNWWAFALLVVAALGFAIDVQAARSGSGPWSAIAGGRLAVHLRRLGGVGATVVGVAGGVPRDVVVHARWHDRDDPRPVLDPDGRS